MTLSVSQLYFAEPLSVNYLLKTTWSEVKVAYLRNYLSIRERTKENLVETQGSRCPG
jgi:hypothetical protein